MTTGPDDTPEVDELVGLVERLDADNEHLRIKGFELMRVMEEIVTEQVAAERRVAELEERNRQLADELAALHRTKLMRFSAPFRRVYGRVRR